MKVDLKKGGSDIDLRAGAISRTEAYKADWLPDQLAACEKEPITPGESTLTFVGKMALAEFFSFNSAKTGWLLAQSIKIQRFGELAKIAPEEVSKILDKMDTYGGDKDQGVAEESPAMRRFLISPSGLAMNGLVMSVSGRDVAYAGFYPVKNEYQLSKNGHFEKREDLPPELAECHDRANWLPKADRTEASSLCERIVKAFDLQLSNEEVLERLIHLYDYAVPLHEDRCQGWGKLAVLLGRVECTPRGHFSVGFIDCSNPDHFSSFPASLQAGSVMIGKLEISPDGEHPSVISVFPGGRKIEYGEVFMSMDDFKRGLSNGVKALTATLESGDNAIAYNTETRCIHYVKTTNEINEPRELVFRELWKKEKDQSNYA